MKISAISSYNTAAQPKIKKEGASPLQVNQTQVTMELPNYKVAFGTAIKSPEYKIKPEIFERNPDGTYKHTPEEIAAQFPVFTTVNLSEEELRQRLLVDLKDNPEAKMLILTQRSTHEAWPGRTVAHVWNGSSSREYFSKKWDIAMDALKDQPIALKDILAAQDSYGHIPAHEDVSLLEATEERLKAKGVDLGRGFFEGLRWVKNNEGKLPGDDLDTPQFWGDDEAYLHDKRWKDHGAAQSRDESGEPTWPKTPYYEAALEEARTLQKF